MSLLQCSRREEVSVLLAKGHWPAAAAVELRAHVEGCRGCSEMVLLTQVMRQAREDSAQVARLEPAGLIWWRAQLRRRRAAMESVSKPMWRAQIFAVSVSLVVAVAFLTWRAEQAGGWRAWLGGSLGSITAGMGLLPLVMGGVALMLLGGLVVWLTFERE
jgi:hypothetical protein